MKNSSKPQLRSTSLPLSLTPSSSQIEINLNKFKTLVPFYSSASIHDGLACLIDLYLSVDELICSSQIQQVHLQSGNRTLIEDALDASTQLLDSYSKLVELLTIIKENVRTLQIALRRKSAISVDSSRSEVHISDYVLSRKKTRKHIVECLGSLEQMEKETNFSHIIGEDCHLSMVIRVLREIVIATISLFRALTVCMSGKTKIVKGFSFKKFMTLGRQSCDINKEYISDVDIIDGTLQFLSINIRENESTKTIEKQMAMERLQNLECQIGGYEVGLECLFRKVIQTRVSLLNILTN